MAGLRDPDRSQRALVGHTATSVGGGRIVVFGGAVLDNDTELAALTSAAHLLDLATETWTPLQAVGAVPAPRVAHAAACVAPGRLMMHGGSLPAPGQEHGHVYNELHSLELEGQQAWWRAVSTSEPRPPARYGHAMAFCHPHLVVFGGSAMQGLLSDLWVLDLESQPPTWHQVPARSCWPQARVHHSVSTCTDGGGQGTMLMFGGCSSSRRALGDAWTLNRLDGRWEWRSLPAANSEQPAARFLHSCVALGTQFLVVGGCNGSHGEGEALATAAFDIDTGRWHSLPECHRLQHACCAEGSTLCLIGGLDNSSLHTPILDRFSLVSPASMGELRSGRGSVDDSLAGYKCTSGVLPADSQQAPPLRVMELFAGTGGFSVAAEALDMRTVAVSAADPEFLKVLADRYLHALVFGDLSGLNVKGLRKLLPHFDIMTGSFQGQTSTGAGNLRSVLDNRADVFNIIPLVLRAKQPLALLLENVAVPRSNIPQDGQPGDAVLVMLEELRKVGYTAAVQVANYNGQDQFYIVGFRADLGIELQDGAIVDANSLQRTVSGILDLATQSERDLSDKVVHWLSRSSMSMSSDSLKRCSGPYDRAGCFMAAYSAWRTLFVPRGSCTKSLRQRRSNGPAQARLGFLTSSLIGPWKAGHAVSQPAAALLLGTVGELLREHQSGVAPSSSDRRWATWRLLGASSNPGRNLPRVERPITSQARLPHLLAHRPLEGQKGAVRDFVYRR